MTQLTRKEAKEQGYLLARDKTLDYNEDIDMFENEDLSESEIYLCEKEPYKVDNNKEKAWYRVTDIRLIP